MEKNLDTQGLNTEQFKDSSAEDLFKQAFSQKEDVQSAIEQESNVSDSEVEQPNDITEKDSDNISPTEAFEEYLKEAKAEEDGTKENNAAQESEAKSDTPKLSEPNKNSNDSKDKDIETMFVKGAEGRKEELKIDYTDRKAIKDAYVKAAGMRKYQAERDNALKKNKAISKEYETLKSDFSKLEEAFEKDGAKGIISLLGGDEAWSQAVDAELKHREYIANLSAEEKYQLELKEKEERYQSELQREKLARQEFEQKIQEKEELAQIQALESKLHPAFDRYRFAGKLGDPVAENFYDEAIFSKVKERLSEYPDDVDLTQAIIDKEVRTVANAFRKHINAQAEKKVKSTIETKKADASKRAQVAAKKGLGGQTQARQIMENLAGGDLGGALSNFFSKRN